MVFCKYWVTWSSAGSVSSLRETQRTTLDFLLGLAFWSVVSCLKMPGCLWEVPPGYTNIRKLKCLCVAGKKKQRQFLFCLGNILPIQEIIHTRNGIFILTFGNSPSRKRQHPSSDFKKLWENLIVMPAFLMSYREYKGIIRTTSVCWHSFCPLGNYGCVW